MLIMHNPWVFNFNLKKFWPNVKWMATTGCPLSKACCQAPRTHQPTTSIPRLCYRINLDGRLSVSQWDGDAVTRGPAWTIREAYHMPFFAYFWLICLKLFSQTWLLQDCAIMQSYGLILQWVSWRDLAGPRLAWPWLPKGRPLAWASLAPERQENKQCFLPL